MTQFQQQPYQPYPVGGPPVQPQPPKKKRRWPWVVGGIAVVFVMIGVAANAGSGSGTTEGATTTPAATASSYAPEATQGDVSVPTDLVGQTLAAASTELTNLGFDQYQIMSSPGLQSTVQSCQADVTTCKTLKVTNVGEQARACSRARRSPSRSKPSLHREGQRPSRTTAPTSSAKKSHRAPGTPMDKAPWAAAIGSGTRISTATSTRSSPTTTSTAQPPLRSIHRTRLSRSMAAARGPRSEAFVSTQWRRH